MTDDSFASSQHVEDMSRIYSPDLWAVYDRLDQSLDPRGPDMLHELAARHLSAGARILDAGCRDAEHLIRLVKAHDATGVGVDPIAWHIERAHTAVADASVEDRVEILHGVMEQLPYPDQHFDLVWCRDVLTQVEELDAALGEAARLVKPDGRMIVSIGVVTDELLPAEAAILARHLGGVPGRDKHGSFETAFARAGFDIEMRDEIGTEWKEHSEERAQPVSKALLRLARLRRQHDEIVEQHGADIFDHLQANLLYEVYQFLGKLQPVVYVLRLAR